MVTYQGVDYYTTRDLAIEYKRPQTTVCRAIRTLGVETTTVLRSDVYPEGAGGALKLISSEEKKKLDNWAHGAYAATLDQAALFLGCSSARLDMFSGEGKIPTRQSGRGNRVWSRETLDVIKNSGLIKGIYTDWSAVMNLFKDGEEAPANV